MDIRSTKFEEVSVAKICHIAYFHKYLNLSKFRKCYEMSYSFVTLAIIVSMSRH